MASNRPNKVGEYDRPGQISSKLPIVIGAIVIIAIIILLFVLF